MRIQTKKQQSELSECDKNQRPYTIQTKIDWKCYVQKLKVFKQYNRIKIAAHKKTTREKSPHSTYYIVTNGDTNSTYGPNSWASKKNL